MSTRTVTKNVRGEAVLEKLRVPHDIGTTVNVEVVEEPGTRAVVAGDVVITATKPEKEQG